MLFTVSHVTEMVCIALCFLVNVFQYYFKVYICSILYFSVSLIFIKLTEFDVKFLHISVYFCWECLAYFHIKCYEKIIFIYQ